MVQTITPVVHGGSRRRWAVSLVLHLLGATISAAASGAVLGGAGALLGAPWSRGGMLIVVALAIVYAAREIFGLPLPLPELRRQVPEWWRAALGVRTSAFLYGLALGPGVGTHLRHGTLVAVGASAVALGDPVLGMALVAPFGAARALAVSLASSPRTESGRTAMDERLERLGSGAVPRIANGAVLLALAGVAAVSTAGHGAPPAWLWPSLLAATFGWAALAKWVGRGAWRESIQAYGLPRPVERLALRVVPVLEASTALLLLTGSIQSGAAAALLLLGAFTAALANAGRGGVRRLACGCFGGRARRTIPWLVGRNAGLSVLAIATLASGRPIPVEVPGGAEALPGALAAGGGILAAWVLRRAVILWPRQEIRPFGTN